MQGLVRLKVPNDIIYIASAFSIFGSKNLEF
jgi:hypothetical protein